MGAVLCIAMINASVKAYADTRKPEGSEEICNALGGSSNGIVKFPGKDDDQSEAESAFFNRYYDRATQRSSRNAVSPA